MSPELTFALTLLLRMAVTAAFVVSASVITERSGPVIGALVATLPISAGPSYVFLALTYVGLAQRRSVLVSLGAAVTVWFALAALVRSVPWTLASGLAVNAVAFAICLPLMARFRHAKMPVVIRQWYDIPLRAALVAALVATVVTLSSTIGPAGSGILALYPVVLTSLMLLLQPRIGGPATAAVIANGGWGLMGFGLSIAVLHVTAVPLGSGLALSLALAICVAWNLGLWTLGRRRAVPS